MRSVERVERFGTGAILYDGALANHIDDAWFDRAAWPGAQAAPGYSGGRGATLFIHCQGQDWVLRHYYRGGAVAQVARDGFVWLGEERTRSFAEWRLLAQMHALGLPVPRPVAARYQRSGILYRADLITARIPGVMPLSARLVQGPIDAATWQRVGACVAKFHRAGFFHADLTAHNLQISDAGDIFLLDFDRGRKMPGDGWWQQRNIRRLHRSLTKISADGAIGFSPGDWAAILAGYRAAFTGATSRDGGADSPPAQGSRYGSG